MQGECLIDLSEKIQMFRFVMIGKKMNFDEKLVFNDFSKLFGRRQGS